ncbi:hypothetical protein HK102_011596, partial [Quaeritorhiza haematococci]
QQVQMKRYSIGEINTDVALGNEPRGESIGASVGGADEDSSAVPSDMNIASPVDDHMMFIVEDLEGGGGHSGTREEADMPDETLTDRKGKQTCEADDRGDRFRRDDGPSSKIREEDYDTGFETRAGLRQGEQSLPDGNDDTNTPLEAGTADAVITYDDPEEDDDDDDDLPLFMARSAPRFGSRLFALSSNPSVFGPSMESPSTTTPAHFNSWGSRRIMGANGRIDGNFGPMAPEGVESGSGTGALQRSQDQPTVDILSPSRALTIPHSHEIRLNDGGLSHQRSYSVPAMVSDEDRLPLTAARYEWQQPPRYEDHQLQMQQEQPPVYPLSPSSYGRSYFMVMAQQQQSAPNFSRTYRPNDILGGSEDEDDNVPLSQMAVGHQLDREDQDDDDNVPLIGVLGGPSIRPPQRIQFELLETPQQQQEMLESPTAIRPVHVLLPPVPNFAERNNNYHERDLPSLPIDDPDAATNSSLPVQPVLFTATDEEEDEEHEFDDDNLPISYILASHQSAVAATNVATVERPLPPLPHAESEPDLGSGHSGAEVSHVPVQSDNTGHGGVDEEDDDDLPISQILTSRQQGD